MVVSNIINEIKFKEDKNVEKHDKNTLVSMFRINLFDIDVYIGVGMVNTSLYDNVYFAPVYLVLNENVQVKIGIYEFLAEDYTNLLDKDNDLDIAYIEGPLLFNFVTKEYIEDMMEGHELLQYIDSDDELDSEEDGQDTDEEQETDGMKQFMYEEDDEDYLDIIETKQDNDQIVNAFSKETSSSSWIEQFYKNSKYDLLDNEGGGDCLFSSMRDGLRHRNISITVPEIRKMLSDNTTQEQFDTYYENYNLIKKEINDLQQKMSELKKQHEDVRKKYKKTAADAKKEKDRETRLILRDKAVQLNKDFDSIKSVFKRYKDELARARENIKEFQFMDGIETLDDLKQMINTCQFWGDAASIVRLEYLMNIKLIVLSSEYYEMDLKDRVVKCGDFTLNEIETKGYFNPKYYIILDHTGNHYKLIKYDGKGAMRFHELPYQLREDIVAKCGSSRGKSLYNYIPKFQKYMGIPSTMPQQDDEDFGSENEAEMSPSPGKDDVELFDDSVIFQFYSKSKDAMPGKGSGENISPKMVNEFDELKKIKSWRQQLSNLYTVKDSKSKNKVKALFELDGYKWASVEHYYQANKFKKNNMDYYKLFTMESKSEISTDPIAAKGAGGITGKVNNKKFRPKTITQDEDFMLNNNNEDVMYNGQLAKYSQNEDLKKMLMLTKTAKLVHYSHKETIVFYDTMKVRKYLQNKQ